MNIQVLRNTRFLPFILVLHSFILHGASLTAKRARNPFKPEE